MKKYVKPELFYEHFELSQHIADCGWELQSGNKDSCYAVTDLVQWGYEDTLFTSTNGNCNNKIDAGYQQYCYESGGDAIKVFAS